MGHSLRLVLSSALAISLSLALSTARADRLALVIGNDKYQHIEKLSNARNDARMMAQLLREAKFETALVEDVTRTNFWRAIDTLRSRIRKGDEVVIYFAGHGVQVGADPILLPVDIAAENENQLARDGVALIRLQDAIKDARFGLLVVDACRNNPFPRKGTRSIGEASGLAPVEAAEGMAILLSAGRGQTALDTVPGKTTSNGLFTHELVRTLRSPGIGVRSALLSTRDLVENAAQSVGHKQRPTLVDEMRGDFQLFEAQASVGAKPARPDPQAPDPIPTTAGAGAERTTLGTAPRANAKAERQTPEVQTARTVQLLWEGHAVLGSARNAEIEATFAKSLQSAGIALTLPTAPEASITNRLSAAVATSSHVLWVRVVPDARSPVGAGFQMNLRSSTSQRLLMSHYSLAPPPGAPPARTFKFVATDNGFQKVETTVASVQTPSDIGSALAQEIKDEVKRVLD
jgi:uncharacterized caspase-like protein